jgi:hypothetical protein
MKTSSINHSEQTRSSCVRNDKTKKLQKMRQSGRGEYRLNIAHIAVFQTRMIFSRYPHPLDFLSLTRRSDGNGDDRRERVDEGFGVSKGPISGRLCIVSERVILQSWAQRVEILLAILQVRCPSVIFFNLLFYQGPNNDQ